ncbi:16S rRNA (cytidine(1402)-2'-O)-methyltransferase [Thermospira aquatica]|uniref:16S rRNA (Cytidine(1402)-2'-O)-methyltransferase n=1 Tax=Thermospira aquatica TaxID=2828656 RepID=A0AAX3BEJ0_9SPIR|nr:16S rRNA (cytidine(1402)-2'-O)-methyltransferase [Thermospira aquatica]URA10656.1 16S rRNA (cytidine(1402)-2'-O)-methyltransferase [Thermospira aquatica]
MKEGKLYVVATPIGNLEDISLRALETLKQVDRIACEHPERHRKLLSHFGIHKPVLQVSAANETNSAKGIVQLLLQGESIALVSDAGTPGISDPGKEVVEAARQANIPVIPVPGPSALTAVLSVLGESPKDIVFVGFLPKTPGKIAKILRLYRELEITLIGFVSSFQIKKFLQILNEQWGNVEILIGREITKLHESWVTGRVTDILETGLPEEGEWTIAIKKWFTENLKKLK